MSDTKEEVSHSVKSKKGRNRQEDFQTVTIKDDNILLVGEGKRRKTFPVLFINNPEALEIVREKIETRVGRGSTCSLLVSFNLDLPLHDGRIRSSKVGI